MNWYLLAAVRYFCQLAVFCSLAGLTLAPARAAGSCDTVQFPVLRRLFSGGAANDVKMVDVNGDGKLDLLILVESLNVAFGDGMGGFSPLLAYGSLGFATLIATGDFNGDGFPDAVTADFPGITIFLNNGSGGYSVAEFINSGAEPSGLAVADFNRDGKMDVSVADFQASSISFYAGDGSGGFAAPVTFATGIQPSQLAVGDFDGDGLLDLAVAEYGAMDIRIFKGSGDGHFTAGAINPLGGNTQTVVAADFNHDGVLDLAANVFNIAVNHLEVFLGNGDGSFRDFQSISVTVFSGLVTADFNGDGNVDLAFREDGAKGLGVTLGDGTGAFDAPVFTPVPHGEIGSISLGAGDLNGDGTIDVASGSFQSSRVTIFFNGPSVSIQASDRAASEDGRKGKFIVTRDGCDAQALTVFYTVSGTATNGVDYRALKGRVKIPAGKDSTTITVAPIDDSIPEGTETVVLTLSAETTYGISGVANATVSILDND